MKILDYFIRYLSEKGIFSPHHISCSVDLWVLSLAATFIATININLVRHQTILIVFFKNLMINSVLVAGSYFMMGSFSINSIPRENNYV